MGWLASGSGVVIGSYRSADMVRVKHHKLNASNVIGAGKLNIAQHCVIKYSNCNSLINLILK